MMRLKITFLIAVLLAFFAPAQAGPISGEPVYGGTMIVATDGSVRAIYLGSDAGYFNSLYLDAADPIASTPPFSYSISILKSAQRQTWGGSLPVRS